MAIKEFKTKEQLQSVHEFYKKNASKWKDWSTAYEGGDEFIKASLFKNPRETYKNFRVRLKEAISFNYAGSIVDLFNFYLTEKAATRKCESLKGDKQWDMFKKDSNLIGMDYNQFLDESHKLASVYSAFGILVDKPKFKYNNLADEIRNRVYPYVCGYTMPNILDWEFVEDKQTGRKVLNFLKLKMPDDIYYIWHRDRWEKWEITSKNVVTRIDSGPNELGEIPFVWMSNTLSVHGFTGAQSDLKDIAKIVSSVIRNISCGDEVIKYAGFPIFAKPMEIDDGSGEDDGEGEHVISINSVEEYNAEEGPAAIPRWIETQIMDPIEAILKWTDRKIDEIFRLCHLSGVHGQRKSNNEVSSGLALRYEFQQLFSVLNKKANAMIEADLSICKYWLMWQNKIELWDELEINRAKDFSIDEMAVSLDNLTKSMGIVISDTFKREIQKKIVKQQLPDLTPTVHAAIDKEIDNAKIPEPDEPNKPDQNNNSGDNE